MVLGWLALLSCAVGGLGLTGVMRARNAQDDTYHNRLGSSIAISKASILMVRAALSVEQASADRGADSASQLLKDAAAYIRSSDAWWDKYAALPRSDAREAQLAEQTRAQRNALENQGLRPAIDFLSAHDGTPIDTAKLREIGALLLQMNDANTALNNYQNTLGQARYEQTSRTYWFFAIGTSLALVEEAAAAAQSLQTQSGELASAAGRFRLG